MTVPAFPESSTSNSSMTRSVTSGKCTSTADGCAHHAVDPHSQTIIYGPSEPLPPLPVSKGWDPGLGIEELSRKAGERRRTLGDLSTVTSALVSADIPCCLVGVVALQHFGAKRVSDEVDICVPASQLDDARRVLLNLPHIFTPVKPRNRYDPTELRHTFPWFKMPGVHAFFVLIPDSALGFTCALINIEQSPKSHHLPYPKAARWAEALVNLSKAHSAWRVDLDDFVDGLAATEQWGSQNLSQECLERFSQSVRGIRKRMMGKYPEDRYITRFRKIVG